MVNICSLVVAALFFLLNPQPMLEPEWGTLVFAGIHATLFTAWFVTGECRGKFLLSVLIAAAVVYGGGWLLIATQLRGNLQDLFLNPYFVSPQWYELWAPLWCATAFLVVALTMYCCASMIRRTTIGLIVGVAIWATLYGIIIFGPASSWFYSEVSRLTRPKPKAVFHTPGSYATPNYNDGRKFDAQAFELFRESLVHQGELPENYCEKLTKSLSAAQLSFAIYRLLKEEPQFSAAFDQYLRQRYRLQAAINSDDAWSKLELLSNEPITNWTWPRQKRAVELLSPCLESQQLIDYLLEADSTAWPAYSISLTGGIQFNWRTLPENNQLKPFVYAAWFLEQQEKETKPGHYNQFEKTIGSLEYRRRPPQPLSNLQRSLIEGGTSSEESEWSSLLERLFAMHSSRPPPRLCSGREYDEFLRRRWLKSMGPESDLGSAKILQSEYDMLFLDTNSGARWRSANQERLLELASKSIAPPHDEPNSKQNRDVSTALGAVAKVLGSQGSRDRWPIPEHLEFLFLDNRTEQRPTMAMQFWPEFDAGLDSIDVRKLSARLKLLARWNYLARLSPESTAEMFVECYLRTPPRERQWALVGSCGLELPGTLAPDVQLEILSGIKRRLAENPDNIGDGRGGFGLFFHDRTTENELETIDLALSGVACRDGANRYVEEYYNACKRKGRGLNHLAGFQGYQSVCYRLAESENVLAGTGRRWVDERLHGFANHEDPEVRLYAVRAIRCRPVKEYMPALERLRQDENEKVSAAANEVAEFLEQLRAR